MSAPSHSQVVTLKVTHNRLAIPGDQTVEKSLAIDRSKFLKIKTKESLTEVLSETDLSLSGSSASLIKYLRKSKKHKEYVPLETEDDFKSLSRSLKVKNHVKLIINDNSPADGHYKKRKASTIDFSSLGDALIEAAFDHFKDLFADLPRSTGGTDNSSLEDGKRKSDGDNKQAGQNAEELPIHVNVACDSCNPKDTSFVPIRGVRYSCLVCPNFDLCESCEAECTTSKRSLGVHNFMHPMAKLSHPDQDFNRKKFNLGSRGCRAWNIPSQFPPNYSRDIVYDIPLENCTDETKERLEILLQKNGIDSFINNVQKFIDNSDKYEELVALSQRNSENGDVDEEVKFAILKSMIDSCLSSASSISLPDSTAQVSERMRAPFESVPAHCSEKVLVKPKKIGDNARVISLMLTNTSEVTIEGGDLKFEFHNDKQNEVVIIKNASNVKPGQQRFYNLGKLNDNFNRLSGMRLRITSSNLVLEGEYNESEDSELWIAQDTGVTSSVDEVKEVGSTNSQILDNRDEINVTVVPKSSTAAQIIISNRSEKTIDCSYLKLEIVNCFNRSVVTVIVRKKHGILPGKVGKFNIGLIDAHMKYPFKLVMKNDFNVGYCDLNFKKLSDNLIFEKESSTYVTKKEHYVSDDEEVRTSGTESICDEKFEREDIQEEDEALQPAKSNKEVTSLSSSLNESIHSMVLPALPRESSVLEGSSEYLDAQASIGVAQKDEVIENDDDDYDIISVEGDPETDSDFEVLSPIISNQ